MDGVHLPLAYTWTEARQRGATARQITQDGVRLGHGLYLSCSADPSLTARCSAGTRRLPPGAAFGLGTATALYGVGDPEQRTDHVVLSPRSELPQHAELTVHARRMVDEDVTERAGLQRTSGALTFLDMAALLPPADLLALGHLLMRVGVLDRGSLVRRLARADRVRGVVPAREWAPHLTGKAASPPESGLRYRLLVSDLPDPEVQVPVLDRWGRVAAHADLGYSRWKVALEYEGRQHGPSARRARAVRPGRRPLLADGRRRLAGAALCGAACGQPRRRRRAHAAGAAHPRLGRPQLITAVRRDTAADTPVRRTLRR